MNIKAILDDARRDLLDLGLRNSLLNFRKLKARGVDVVDEHPGEVFRILVSDDKRMSFMAREDIESGNSGAHIVPIDLSAPISDRHTDNKLQTSETSGDLQLRLLRTFDSARTSLQEQGINSLYLALGMLEWREAAKSEEVRKAPLVLIPVSINRASVKERFSIAYTGDDISTNFSLAEKLRAEFALTLPDVAGDEDLDILGYFEKVAEVVSSQSNWRVDRTAISLGFFSFAKYQIYRDLDASLWPAESNPAEHPILSALLSKGFTPSGEISLDGKLIDDIARPTDLVQVVDADSSQILAMLEAKRGANFVIQGPPGTGKSQTITNLIADAVESGKRVLFVAEKSAALEVVKAKLKQSGLGDLCLELHSDKSNKREVLSELRRTYDVQAPKSLDGSDVEFERLSKLRGNLNAYCSALHTPIAGSMTPFAALAGLIASRTAGQEKTRFELASLGTMGDAGFKELETAATEIQAILDRIGDPRKLPYYGTTRASVTPVEEVEGSVLLQQACATVRELQTHIMALDGLELIDKRRQASIAATQDLIAAVMANQEILTVNVSRLSAVDLDSASTLVAKAEARRDLSKELEGLFSKEAFEKDLAVLSTTVGIWAKRWWRFVSGAWRRARREFSGIYMGPKISFRDWPMLLSKLQQWRESELSPSDAATIESLTENSTSTFAGSWIGALSHYVALVKANGASNLLLRVLKAIAPVESRQAILQQINRATEAEKRAAEMMGTVNRYFGLPEVGKERHPPLDADALILELDEFQRCHAKFRDTVAYRRSRVRAESLGLKPLIEAVEATLSSEERLDMRQALVYARCHAVAKRAYLERPTLQEFSSAQHMLTIDEFAKLDRRAIGLDRLRAAHRHYDRMPKASESLGEMRVLREEWQKKRKHLPLRMLLVKSGNAIQRIKPVFMMSPMSVATYLRPGGLGFDLVIFDEASQVRPVDAFGALIRGNQAIVVGDSRQLPPTSFFDKLDGTDEDDAADGGDGDKALTRDFESILSLFEARSAPTRMLRWHYRSRHHSLITVSNDEFYDGKLRIFPGAALRGEELGLRLIHDPTTVYEAGKTRSNPKEAEAIAHRVMEFARRGGDRSLGVGTFSQAQREAIEDAIERLRRADPSAEEFFSQTRPEPFFVKNLENIQGDERDIILISVGYGRTESGSFPLRFGPLNREGGERRLNVLITRARVLCEVYANFKAENMDMTKTKARGVAALKRYLEFAENGRYVGVPKGDQEFDSPFEEAVYAELVKQGYSVHTQIGCRGFSIDLGVIHPDKPGNYILGIECDGATYHSALSARDRDRLRQEVLERLGWRIHRIWSSDWFANSERETNKVVQAIEALRLAVQPEQAREEVPATELRQTSSAPAEVESAEHVESGVAFSAYKLANLDASGFAEDFYQTQTFVLATKVSETMAAESPIHIDEVVTRVVQASGTQRAGNRVRARMEAVIEHLIRKDEVMRRGNFLWRNGQQSIVARNRAFLPQNRRKIEFIAPEEIDAAILLVVRKGISMEQDEIERSALEGFGFSRITAGLRSAVAERIVDLIHQGRLVMRDNVVRERDEAA